MSDEEGPSNVEIIRRCWAVLATVADDRFEDIDPMLADLSREEVVHVLCGVASVSLHWLAGEDHERLPEVADQLRALLLEHAANED